MPRSQTSRVGCSTDSRAARRPTTGTIVRARAPLRISFAGGGTDVPQFYETHGGAVLSSTINRYAYVTVYSREDQDVRIRSLDTGYSVEYNASKGPRYDGVLDLVKASIQRMGAEHGMEVDVRTDAPAGSGLGGSSALTAAVIGALSSLIGAARDCRELAELNYSVERHDLKIAGGKQDQYATTFGGLNLIEFSKDEIIVNPLCLERDVLNDLEAHLLLCYTGRSRADLGLVDQQIRFYSEGRPATLQGMRALHRGAYEMRDALVKGRLDDFGCLLSEAYANKKRMNPNVADGTITDDLLETAYRHGATGGKLCGAGGGGYIVLYCPTDRQHEVRRALEARGGQFTDFAFDQHGLQRWRSRHR